MLMRTFFPSLIGQPNLIREANRTGPRKSYFPFSDDHEQDLQQQPVDYRSAERDDNTRSAYR